MKEINIEDIIKNSKNINIIDIREGYLYAIDRIENAINIPESFLLVNKEKYLKKDKIYYIYCSYGITSKKTCEKLNNDGYNVISIKGGFQAYKKYLKELKKD